MSKDLTELEKKLLRTATDALHRVRDHDRLVSSLVTEIAKLQRAKSEVEEKYRGEFQIRRIAFTLGIPQKVVLTSFQEWLNTKDFSELQAKYKGGI